MSSAWSWSASVWSPIARSWRAGSWRPMTAPRAGADAAGVQEDPGHRHAPLGWRPTTLLVTIRRYRCTGCGHVWRQDTSRAAEPRARLSRRGLAWALEAIVCQHLSIARVAQGLGVAWNTANDAVLAEGLRVLINDPGRLNGVKVIGVDEHVWRHTRRGDKYVTVIIDLTPVRAGTGPARLLDMIPGRSKATFKAWLTQRPQAWREAVEVVAMDGFTGFKTAAAEEIPAAVAVMDPLHAKPPSAALPCPATRPRAVRRQSRPRPARGRTRPAGCGVRRLRRRRTGGCGRSGRARAGPDPQRSPLGNQLPDDLHHVDRGVEHDQVAQQRVPFDRLFLLGRVVLGDHALVAGTGVQAE